MHLSLTIANIFIYLFPSRYWFLIPTYVHHRPKHHVKHEINYSYELTGELHSINKNTPPISMHPAIYLHLSSPPIPQTPQSCPNKGQWVKSSINNNNTIHTTFIISNPYLFMYTLFTFIGLSGLKSDQKTRFEPFLEAAVISIISVSIKDRS